MLLVAISQTSFVTSVLMRRAKLGFVVPFHGTCIFVGNDILVHTKRNLITSVNCDGRKFQTLHGQGKLVPESLHLHPLKCSVSPEKDAIEELERIVDQVCFGMTSGRIQEFLDTYLTPSQDTYPIGSMGQAGLLSLIPFALSHMESSRPREDAVFVEITNSDFVASHTNFHVHLHIHKRETNPMRASRVSIRQLTCSHNQVLVETGQQLALTRPVGELLVDEEGRTLTDTFTTLCDLFFDKVALFTSVASLDGVVTTFWNAANSQLRVEANRAETAVLSAWLSCHGEHVRETRIAESISLTLENISFAQLCTVPTSRTDHI